MRAQSHTPLSVLKKATAMHHGRKTGTPTHPSSHNLRPRHRHDDSETRGGKADGLLLAAWNVARQSGFERDR
jgi:hypothetical protein